VNYEDLVLKKIERPQETVKIGDLIYVVRFYQQGGTIFVSMKASTLPIGMSLASYELLEKEVQL